MFSFTGRLIINKDNDTPSTFLFSQLKWSFPERVIYQKAIQMYKTLSGTSPNYLKIQFTFTSDIHSRTLRSSHKTQLYIPKPRIVLLRNTFFFLGLQFGTVFPILYVTHRTLTYFRSDI